LSWNSEIVVAGGQSSEENSPKASFFQILWMGVAAGDRQIMYCPVVNPAEQGMEMELIVTEH
jgi:hypothetical protein